MTQLPLSNNQIECVVCGGTEWCSFLRTTTNLIMQGDRSVGPGNLSKEQCVGCGCVVNPALFSSKGQDELYQHYGGELSSLDEHFFISSAGEQSRSDAIFEWLTPHFPSDAHAISEIGCGAGKVLGIVADSFPNAQCVGLEGNPALVQLAKANGLEVHAGLVGSDTGVLPPSDVIYSFAVLEHIPQLIQVLGTLKRMLKPGGRLVMAMPIQDTGSYDMFFAEHVWHVSMDQYRAIFERAGFQILMSEIGSHPHDVYGLVVCQLEQHVAWSTKAIPEAHTMMTQNRDYWLDVIAKTNVIIQSYQRQSLAVFGAGEFFSFLKAYTRLSDITPLICLVDVESSDNRQDSDDIVSHIDDVDVCSLGGVIVALKKQYWQMVSAKLTDRGFTPISVFKDS